MRQPQEKSPSVICSPTHPKKKDYKNLKNIKSEQKKGTNTQRTTSNSSKTSKTLGEKERLYWIGGDQGRTNDGRDEGRTEGPRSLQSEAAMLSIERRRGRRSKW